MLLLLLPTWLAGVDKEDEEEGEDGGDAAEREGVRAVIATAAAAAAAAAVAAGASSRIGQSRIVRSAEPDARYCPQGDQATDQT